jgi:hypothetical protein
MWLGRRIVDGIDAEDGSVRVVSNENIEYEQQPDGRFIGSITRHVIVYGEVTVSDRMFLHECPYGGGGTAGDRAPTHPRPPSDALPIELDP